MIHERDRMARRGDKYWCSVWHIQMCMGAHDAGPKPLRKATPLTDGSRVFMVKLQSKPKPNPGSSGNRTKGDV
jgi:hypothetical protein